MQTSAKYLNDQTELNGGVYHTQIQRDKVYISIADVKGVQNLGWRIISVIPESDLMGDVITRQYT